MVEEIQGGKKKKRGHNSSRIATLNSASNTMENGTSIATLDAAEFPNQDGSYPVLPEGIKGRKFSELTVTELEELGEINANQDRFRHRFSEDDYKNDLVRANASIRWID